MRETLRRRRTTGLIISMVTYVVALIAGILVTRATSPGHPLADLGLGTGVATVVVFVVSAAVDNSSIYDPYWSLQPAAIAGYYLWTRSEGPTARLLLVSALLAVYAARLTSNFYRDWPGLAKEDFRYRAFRGRFGSAYWPVSFFGIHLFPTIVVYLGCLPLYAVSRADEPSLWWLDGLGAAVMLGAVCLAFAADEQMRRFRKESTNSDRAMRRGLWRYSRHPNYLGEITTWWGLWLFALAAGGRWWWTIVGALAITLIFVFVSIPMMEERLLTERPEYAAYRDETAMLIPWRRAKGTTGRRSRSG